MWTAGGALAYRALVDTGSDYTWIGETVAKGIGVAGEKRDTAPAMANGQMAARSLGFELIRVDGHFTIDKVVFSREGDLNLLSPERWRR